MSKVLFSLISCVMLYSYGNVLGNSGGDRDTRYDVILSWHKDADKNGNTQDNLTFPQTKFATCGPYKIKVCFKAKEYSAPVPKKISFIDWGAAGSIVVEKDGRLTVKRQKEQRCIPELASSAISSFSILQLDTDIIHTLEVRWTGRVMQLKVDDVLWAQFPVKGTKVTGVLKINGEEVDIISVMVKCP